MKESFSIPGCKLFKQGKVRDLYTVDIEKNTMLIVTTDRISAFDKIIGNIKGKGIVLNSISNFWKKYFLFLLETDIFLDNGKFIFYKLGISEDKDFFERTSVVRKIKPLPFEFIVRGYMTGGLFEKYKNNNFQEGYYLGNYLPEGIKEAEMLPHPIFTPSTKSDVGHDVDVYFWDIVQELGYTKAQHLRTASIALYSIAHQHLLKKKVVVADTKFEFGFLKDLSGFDHLILIDEVLTPDSSRFWDLDKYSPGRPQESFDKQPFRDWLIRTGWDKESLPPKIPQLIEEQTIERYKEIERRILSN